MFVLPNSNRRGCFKVGNWLFVKRSNSDSNQMSKMDRGDAVQLYLLCNIQQHDDASQAVSQSISKVKNHGVNAGG